MPVRNAAPYLNLSIASILGQSFSDFEFLIRDDGSTDGSRDIIQAWARRDRRIRAFEGPQLGLVGGPNWIVNEARAPLVARMDADDVARSDRFARQLDIFRDCEGVTLVGSLCRAIDNVGKTIMAENKWRLNRESLYVPFPHASVMFRKQAFIDAGGYRSECEYWEDLDLFLRLSRHGSIYVITDPLLDYRISDSGVRMSSDPLRYERAMHTSLKCLDLLSAGQSYDHLLGQPGAGSPPKVHPFVFVSRGSAPLWSKAPVRELGPLWKRGALRFDWLSLQCFVWALWARVSPASLRLALRTVHGLRDALAWRVARDRLYHWRPGELPIPVELASVSGKPAPARQVAETADDRRIELEIAEPHPVGY